MTGPQGHLGSAKMVINVMIPPKGSSLIIGDKPLRPHLLKEYALALEWSEATLDLQESDTISTPGDIRKNQQQPTSLDVDFSHPTTLGNTSQKKIDLFRALPKLPLNPPLPPIRATFTTFLDVINDV